ncbi:hypothetical protein FO519_002008 [Halicephalobus sp. NKZ332]|nr:hypothetical protein FO519_002008 [Halicephalobus sp. NKZ332]
MLPILIFLGVFLSSANGQVSVVFGNAIQAPNCAEWSNWGPCVWVKGKKLRWNKSYFEQLLPGRSGCRHHIFYRLLQDRWGQAFSNFFEYVREVTISEEPCGECSYQQSCGRQCHRKGDLKNINPLFVAERRCARVDQSESCVSKNIDNCRLWPNPRVLLPNVTDAIKDIVNGFDYLTCIPQQRENETVCRCCCHPFTPNPETFKCEPKPYLLENKENFSKDFLISSAGNLPPLE